MSNDVSTYYKAAFKGWPKQAGDKPTAALLATAHMFGRPGKQSLALAMALRDNGVTGAQVVLACGAPQNNHRTAVVKRGYFKNVAAPLTDAGHKVYRVELTAKGNAKLTKVAAEPVDKPAKAPRKPRPAKAPAAAVEAPVEAPPASGDATAQA